MGVMMYKADEKPVCIDHTEMSGYESMGWSIHENLGPAFGPIEDSEEKAKLAMAVLEYEQKFGDKPHHRMKLETILEKLNGNEPVQPE